MHEDNMLVNAGTSENENDYYFLFADNQEESTDYYPVDPYQYDEQEDDCKFIYIFNTILSGTARLNVLLPTATILAFTIFAPVLTSDGECTTLDRRLMGFLLAITASSCVFFSFTDSFKTATGRLYYGVATLRGIKIFGRGNIKPCLPVDYRLRLMDIFHASLSLIAFLSFALLHNDVLNCYNLVLPRRFINIFPLVVGFVISLLFVIFPSRRRGIGYPFRY